MNRSNYWKWTTGTTLLLILSFSLPAHADEVVNATGEDLSAFDQLLEQSQQQTQDQERLRKRTEASNLAVQEAQRVRREHEKQTREESLQNQERERHFGAERDGREDVGGFRDQMPRAGQTVRGTGTGGSTSEGGSSGNGRR